jgi:isocitrate/isopropylmalate dehydrogenase
MLRWLGEDGAADGLMECVENVLERGVRTRDLGGSSTTVEVTEAVCEEIERVLGGEKSTLEMK